MIWPINNIKNTAKSSFRKKFVYTTRPCPFEGLGLVILWLLPLQNNAVLHHHSKIQILTERENIFQAEMKMGTGPFHDYTHYDSELLYLFLS